MHLSKLGSKNLLLAAPHPGAHYLLLDTAQNIANDLGIALKHYDYHDFLKLNTSITNSVPPHADSHSELDAITWNISQKSLPKLSLPFTPGLYSDIQDNTDDLDFAESIDTDIDHDSDGDIPEDAVDMTELSRQAAEQGRKAAQTYINSLAVAERDGKSSGSGSNAVGGVMSHFAKGMTDASIKSVLTYLTNSLKSEYETTKKPICVYVSDLSSVFVGSTLSNDTGRKLLEGLTQMVRVLRASGTRIILAVGWSPSLTAANIAKDREFYRLALEGKLDIGGDDVEGRDDNDEELNFALDGVLFRTGLDKMRGFEKMEILPPSRPFLALHRQKEPLVAEPVKSKSQKIEDPINERDQLVRREAENVGTLTKNDALDVYLEQMDIDLGRRIAEINLKSLETCAESKGITSDIESLLEWVTSKNSVPAMTVQTKLEKIEADVGTVSDVPEKCVSDDQQLLKNMLMTSIWSLSQIEKLLFLSIGSQDNSEISLSLTNEALRSGLGVLYDIDISRFSRMSVNEREAIIGTSAEDGGVGLTLPPAPESLPLATQPTVDMALEVKERFKLNKYEKKLLPSVIGAGVLKVGMDELVVPFKTKVALQTLVTLPLLRPEFFAKGVLARGSMSGVLLFGPPGTGKTMLAKAIASSSGATFLSISMSDIFDKYVGEGEKNVRAIFSLARKLTQISPRVVVFLDEVDGVFGARTSDGHRREVVNEFMGVVVLAATNRPFDLDDAILRRLPRRILGIFDTHVVDLPDVEQRKKVLEVCTREDDVDADLELIAKKTDGYSGSDLRNVCAAAALTRIKELIVSESGEKGDWDSVLVDHLTSSEMDKTKSMVSIPPLNQKHFDAGLLEVPPSISEDMATVVQLRKWDKTYGDGAAGRATKGAGYGFLLPPKN